MATERPMMRSLLIACATLPVITTGWAEPAAAREDRCVRNDGQIRRIELAVQDPARGVPCEVVYWKDTEEPGVRRVLWSARTDAKLEAVGWNCTSANQAAAQAPSTPPASTPPVTASTSGAAKPSEPPPSERSEVAPEIKEALAPQQESTPPASASTSATSPADELDAIIEQNLARLNEGVEGTFDALIADYGDLNGDNREDGLVLFTYESQRLGQARFIAAYLFDGQGYTLAATKPLTGGNDRLRGAEVESVDGGVISIRLEVLEPGDAACCPSGVYRQALILRDGELIEVNATASDAGNRS
jgi:hypothetical protein